MNILYQNGVWKQTVYASSKTLFTLRLKLSALVTTALDTAISASSLSPSWLKCEDSSLRFQKNYT